MSSTQLRLSKGVRPLVVVVCAFPLLGVAMRSALDFADVQTFSAAGGDLDGLLRWLRPDALIVDSDDGAQAAAAFARDNSLALLHVSIRDRALRVYTRDGWETIENGDGPTPDAVRNVIAGALFARNGAGG